MVSYMFIFVGNGAVGDSLTPSCSYAQLCSPLFIPSQKQKGWLFFYVKIHKLRTTATALFAS